MRIPAFQTFFVLALDLASAFPFTRLALCRFPLMRWELNQKRSGSSNTSGSVGYVGVVGVVGVL